VAARTKQVPSGEQHAPGGGQGLFVQVPQAVQTPSVHLACSVMLQLPSSAQQTPGGIEDGHGFGAQTVNSANQVSSGSTHSHAAFSSQVPFWSQQAPCGGCGQALGEQVSHPMVQTEVAGQAACGVMVQSPCGVQQPPTGGGSGHGFGRQADQSACQISAPTAQSASYVIVHVLG
jgi:hypothetical protein